HTCLFSRCSHPAPSAPYTLSLHDALPICSVCATPSAAVGSSRMTSLEFHSTARAIATVCRCPPDSEATVRRTEFRVRTDSPARRSEEHTSELQSRENLVCRLLLEKKKTQQ